MTERHHETPSVAIVGAGVSGLACARALAESGCRITLVEKARGPGGRMSTRRLEDLAFDHGAQYFTVRDERFRTAVDGWIEEGLVAEWQARLVTLPPDGERAAGERTRRYVGVPGMSAVTRNLAVGLDPQTGWRAIGAERRRDGWWLTGESRGPLGPHTTLVLAVPAPQALPFLTANSELAERVSAVRLAGCWAVMLGFPERISPEFDGAFVKEGPLSWIARNNSKPGRPKAEAWVLHGSPEWSEAHMDDPARDVIAKLSGAFRAVCRTSLPSPHLRLAHRWRYALPTEPLEEIFLFDEDRAIGVCGDWCGGPRVEGAWVSGRALGEHIGRIVGAGFGYA